MGGTKHSRDVTLIPAARSRHEREVRLSGGQSQVNRCGSGAIQGSKLTKEMLDLFSIRPYRDDRQSWAELLGRKASAISNGTARKS